MVFSERCFDLIHISFKSGGAFWTDPISTIVTIGLPHDAGIALVLKLDVNLAFAGKETTLLYIGDALCTLKYLGNSRRANVNIFDFEGLWMPILSHC